MAKTPADEGAPGLWKVADVARALNVSRSTVYQLVMSGSLPGIYLTSGCLRFRPEAIRKFISDREAATRAELNQSTVAIRPWSGARGRWDHRG